MIKSMLIKYLKLNIILSLFSIVLIVWYKDVPDITMEQLLLFAYGGGGFFFDEFDLVQVIGYMLPLILHLTFYLKFIHNDLDKSVVYIFTRTKKRAYWYMSKLTLITLCSLLFYVFLFLTTIILGFSFGVRIEDFNSMLKLLLYLFLTVGLFNTLVILIGNILTIKLKPNLVYMLITLVTLLQFVIIPLIKNVNLLKILPVSTSILSMHQNKTVKIIFSEIKYLEGFTIEFSLIYMFIILVVFALGGYLLIRKKDLF